MILRKNKINYSSNEKSLSGTTEGFSRVSVMLGAAVQLVGPSSERTEASHCEESCTEEYFSLHMQEYFPCLEE